MIDKTTGDEALHVDDDPGRMEDEEGDDDVEEDQEQVQLLLQLLFCPKSLNLEIIETMSTFPHSVSSLHQALIVPKAHSYTSSSDKFEGYVEKPLYS